MIIAAGEPMCIVEDQANLIDEAFFILFYYLKVSGVQALSGHFVHSLIMF